MISYLNDLYPRSYILAVLKNYQPTAINQTPIMMSLYFITLLKLFIDRVKNRTDRIILPFSLQIREGSITNLQFSQYTFYISN